MGRPVEFTQQRKEQFCAMIAEGKSARQGCRELNISLQTLYRHVREDESFRDQYARAREDAADTLVDELMEIAETEEDVQRAKLKIDARKWVAARMKPKSWGEKQQVEHSGEGGGPLQVTIRRFGDGSESQES
jgi:hypothetical protein